MDEHLLMDDEWCAIPDELTEVMLVTYEAVKAKILEAYASTAE